MLGANLILALAIGVDRIRVIAAIAPAGWKPDQPTYLTDTVAAPYA